MYQVIENFAFKIPILGTLLLIIILEVQKRNKYRNDLFFTFVFFVLEQYQLERGAVHACHAGGVVHLLEGWSHHEVGAIDVDNIDVVWNAAIKHGLKLL